MSQYVSQLQILIIKTMNMLFKVIKTGSTTTKHERLCFIKCTDGVGTALHHLLYSLEEHITFYIQRVEMSDWTMFIKSATKIHFYHSILILGSFSPRCNCCVVPPGGAMCTQTVAEDQQEGKWKCSVRRRFTVRAEGEQQSEEVSGCQACVNVDVIIIDQSDW